MAPPRSCCYWPYGQGEGFQGQSLLISPRAVTFGAFFRNTPATIMRCGRTFRLARTHPAHARSSGSETLSRSRSLAGYTIDTHESEFSEATGGLPILGLALFAGGWPALSLDPLRLLCEHGPIVRHGLIGALYRRVTRLCRPLARVGGPLAIPIRS